MSFKVLPQTKLKWRLRLSKKLHFERTETCCFSDWVGNNNRNQQHEGGKNGPWSCSVSFFSGCSQPSALGKASWADFTWPQSEIQGELIGIKKLKKLLCSCRLGASQRAPGPSCRSHLTSLCSYSLFQMMLSYSLFQMMLAYSLFQTMLQEGPWKLWKAVLELEALRAPQTWSSPTVWRLLRSAPVWIAQLNPTSWSHSISRVCSSRTS